MGLTIIQLRRLLEFIASEHEIRSGLQSLADKMENDFQRGRILKTEKLSRRSMKRILEDAFIQDAVDDTIAARYSAEKLVNSGRTSIPILYRYLEKRNFFHVSVPNDFFGQVSEFFRTNNDVYKKDHLERLIGDYKMYRRCWFHDDGKTFMQSWVRIRADDRSNTYRINERQVFPNFDVLEYSDGFLFPSGKSILGVCNSVQRNSVKFLSISGLFPENSKGGEPIQSFSGNGIASSDTPPHTGYGFHCVRVGKEEILPKRSEHECRIISFEQLKREKFDIFRKIIEYDGFQYVNFVPAEGVT